MKTEDNWAEHGAVRRRWAARGPRGPGLIQRPQGRGISQGDDYLPQHHLPPTPTLFLSLSPSISHSLCFSISLLHHHLFSATQKAFPPAGCGCMRRISKPQQPFHTDRPHTVYTETDSTPLPALSRGGWPGQSRARGGRSGGRVGGWWWWWGGLVSSRHTQHPPGVVCGLPLCSLACRDHSRLHAWCGVN
mgnify:CR=1 FL=1